MCRDQILCSKRALHLIAFVIWLCGVIAVNVKLVLYMITASKGFTSEYSIKCLPDKSQKNRTWIPFSIGLFIGLIQVPFMIKFVRHNYTRIHHLDKGYLCSKEKSCYHFKFLIMLITIIILFVMLDALLCGMDDYSENIVGSKCVFIALDACVGPFLLFGLLGFLISYIYGPFKHKSNNYYNITALNDDHNKPITQEIDDDYDKPVAVL